MTETIEIEENKVSNEERVEILKDIMFENIANIKERFTQEQNVCWDLRYLQNKEKDEIALEQGISVKKVNRTLDQITGQITSYTHFLVGQNCFEQTNLLEKMQKGYENFLEALEQTSNNHNIFECSAMIMGENRKTFAQKALESGKSKKEISKELRDFEIEFRKIFKKIKNGRIV